MNFVVLLLFVVISRIIHCNIFSAAKLWHFSLMSCINECPEVNNIHCMYTILVKDNQNLSSQLEYVNTVTYCITGLAYAK